MLYILCYSKLYFSFVYLAASKKAGFSVQKLISGTEVHGGKTRARHNSLSYPELTSTVRGNYFKNKQQSKNGKVFGKNTYSWEAKYIHKRPKSTYPKLARNEQQVGVTLKRKKQIEKPKPLSTARRSTVRKRNSSKVFEKIRSSKTASANHLKMELLKKLVTLEHKRGSSTKSVSLSGSRQLDEDLAHRAKQRREHISNQSNVLKLHIVNSCNDTKVHVSQLCELKKVLYKLKQFQLKNSKNISFDKELVMKQKSNQSVRAGELSMKLTLFEGGGKASLDKIQFTKRHHRHAKRKAGKRRNKAHWQHFKSLRPKGIDYSGINVASERENKVTDTQKPYSDLSQSFKSSTSFGKSLDAIDEIRPITNFDRVNDVNVQKQSAINPYKSASENNMVANELTYGAAQLDQQQTLRKFQTQQRDAAVQGRMTSLANNQFNIGYPHFYQGMENYPGPSRYRETPAFMSQDSYPLSKYRYPSWRFSLPMLDYQRYPYTLSRRRSSFSSLPWSPMSAVSYDRFLYDRFNQGHGLFGYPRGFRFMPRSFYDTDFDAEGADDDNMSNYNDFDGYDDDKNTDDEEGVGDVYRRMAVSNFGKKGSKYIKSGKSIKKD